LLDLNLRRIPVVILTSSQDQKDILQTYDLHANAYVVKPVALDEFIETIRSLQEF
jgi:chemotaxis family two-component system response regulator Rcp1